MHACAQRDQPNRSICQAFRTSRRLRWIVLRHIVYLETHSCPLFDASSRQESSLLLASGVYDQMITILLCGRFSDKQPWTTLTASHGSATVEWLDGYLFGFHVILHG